MATTQKTNISDATITGASKIASPEAGLAPTATYGEAYAVLSGIAERLRATGASASIDGLAADLRQARAAHAICRARLAAIRAEIDQEVAALDGEAATSAQA